MAECRHWIEYWEGDTHGACIYCFKRFEIRFRQRVPNNAPADSPATPLTE